MDQALRALFRPRHIVVTLAIAIATGALGATAAVAGDQATTQAASAWDLPFAVPHPREGDHGRYVHAGGHDERADGYWPDFIDFAWLAPGSAYNDTGAQVLVNRLAYHEGREGWDRAVRLLVPGTSQEIIGNHESNQTYTDSREGLWPGGNETSVDTIRHVSFRGMTRESGLWCGILNPLQGRASDLRSQLVDPTRCWNGPGSWSIDDYHVVATQVGGLDGGRVAVFEGRYDRQGLMGDASHTFLRSYFREGVAYPVRIEYVSGAVGGDCDCSAIYVLDGLTVGSTPLPTEPQVLASSPTPATMAPRTETGPDATGVSHVFPLTEAWTHARDDTTYAELQDYRVAHTDAYLGQAMYTLNTQDTRAVHRWYIVLTDGEVQFGFFVERTDPNAPTLPVDPGLDGLPAVATPSYRYDRLGDGWEAGPYLPPASLPTEMPTVASMMAGWATFSGSDQPANAWSMDLRCASGEDGQCQPQATYSAGHVADDFAGVSTLASYRTVSQDALEYGMDGRPTGAFTRDTTMTTTVDALPDPAPSPEATDDDAALNLLEATPGTSPGWDIAPREAVAVGGVALLVSLGYFLWPLVKGGGVGLFSRVHKDRLLDNPLRAQLVQRIEAEPGVHHNALVRDLGKGKGAAEHHLDKLVAGGLLLRHRSPGYTCYFPVGTDRRGMPAASATKADGARLVLEALRRGQTGVRAIAATTGLSPSTVSHHLARLRSAGLVTGDGANGFHATGPAPSTAAA